MPRATAALRPHPAAGDPARRPVPRRAPSHAAVRERRQHAAHFARRRRDLAIDAGLGLVLALVLLVWTAGLGILAMVVVPVGAVLAGDALRRRRAGRRRSQASQARARHR